MNLIKSFRIVAILEGVSYLYLLFISMPLKYIWDIPMPNKIGGMIHGLLFILYILMIFPVARKLNWDIKTSLIVAFASIIPFGTFYIEKKYLK